uniref:Uncharacterized protein n=1 Tax=Anguilla anguilla TaxID=7936 RepID=A0A0E9S0Y9_ANGAN
MFHDTLRLCVVITRLLWQRQHC